MINEIINAIHHRCTLWLLRCRFARSLQVRTPASTQLKFTRPPQQQQCKRQTPYSAYHRHLRHPSIFVRKHAHCSWKGLTIGVVVTRCSTVQAITPPPPPPPTPPPNPLKERSPRSSLKSCVTAEPAATTCTDRSGRSLRTVDAAWLTG